ncbi:MAG: PQQ-dependent sugar dehydrogenase [Lewinella sp.]
MVKHAKAVTCIGLLSLFFFSMIDSVSSPPGAMEPYLNGVFPTVTPGFGGTWYLEEALTEIDIAAPLKMVDIPGTEDMLVLCKTGRLWRINPETQTQALLLDISDRTVNYSEAGAVSVALHPEFGQAGASGKQSVFIFYRYRPDTDQAAHEGYNRLSRFEWSESLQAFDADSEDILIQQYDRSAWHNGGGLFFDDGLLYLSVGDEGEPKYQEASNQRLDRGLFCGVLRIDVDNDPNRSHPIRRQPIGNAEPPAGWTDKTFSQGYSIPNDNPWQNESGDLLEEFYAIGVRSPYSTHFDAEEKTIWLSDVGTSKREEINQVEKGDNLQWSYLEGEEWAGSRPAVIIGNEKKPLFHYGNDLGNCVIGGGVYRSDKFVYLNGRYLFADYMSDKIMALRTDVNEGAEAEVLLSDFGPAPLDLPQHSSISGLHYTKEGDILVTTIAWPHTAGGKILHLRQREAAPDPPARLSELAVFTDMERLEVADGILPYDVNAPLWSDRAIKKRWMAIPNDGDFDEAAEQIRFSADEDWTFPEGTVFIKHFDLPTSVSDPNQRTKLETRFFVMAENGTAYGLTYKWNEEQTDAFLQLESTEATYEIFEDDRVVSTQTWGFPGRDQCMSCHNTNANHVLGVKTHQLNGSVFYPGLGHEENQLKYLSDHNILSSDLGGLTAYPQAVGLADASASLDDKIKSYLDANCSSCHRVGGVTGISMDLRFHTPLEAKNILSLPTQSQTSNHDNLLVEPGHHEDSELWIRDQSREENRMPPIGSKLVDEDYIQALAQWIDDLAEDYAVETFLTFPNPSDGWMMLRVNRDWVLPLQVDVYNANGQLVYTEKHDDPNIDLGLQRVGSGLFVLRVTDAAGTAHNQSIVIR